MRLIDRLLSRLSRLKGANRAQVAALAVVAALVLGAGAAVAAGGVVPSVADAGDNPVFVNGSVPGSLSVQKSVTGTDGNSDQDFEFKVVLTPSDGKGVSGEWKLDADGAKVLSGEVKLSEVTAGQTITATASGGNLGSAELAYEWHRVEKDGSDDIVSGQTGATLSTGAGDAGVTYYAVARDKSGKFGGFVRSNEVVVAKKVDVKYAVQLLDIEKDKDVQGHTLGLTFGPATGGNYVATYKSHTPTGTTARGNAHRCLHDDDWTTIVEWASKDPKVYEQCLVEGCTHSVELSMNDNLGSGMYYKAKGDGYGALYTCLKQNYRRWNGMENTNAGGWRASRIRRSLNGFDMCPEELDSSVEQPSAKHLDHDKALIGCFPTELQDAIQAKAVRTRTKYNDAGSVETTSDRLWLLSASEIQTTHSVKGANIPNEGQGQYARYKNAGVTNGWQALLISSRPLMAWSDNSAAGSVCDWVLRSAIAAYSFGAVHVDGLGSVSVAGIFDAPFATAPGFCLGRI